MRIAAKLFAFLAALLHVAFFAMESLYWKTPQVMKIFKRTPEQADITSLMAFNQGFYNLFLAIAIVVGVYMMRSASHAKQGAAIVVYALLSMFAASIVLLASADKALAAAMIQGGPPALALLFFWLTRSKD